MHSCLHIVVPEIITSIAPNFPRYLALGRSGLSVSQAETIIGTMDVVFGEIDR